MLQFKNLTGFAGTIFASPNADGIDSLFAVLKATYVLDADPVLDEQQRPVRFGDEHHGDPATSSIRIPSDMALEKPGTDVLLTGHACAPGYAPVPWLDVSVSVGPVAQTVRVFGNRVWVRDVGGLVASQPQPFARMPLVWERAFGGTRWIEGQQHSKACNPVGIGYRVRTEDRPPEGTPLPNLESPGEPIASWSDSPGPACFAPVCAHWEPRRTFAGTYDERWQQSRAPYLPTDFDPRFFQQAPPGLVAPGHLAGGERVRLVGVCPRGPIEFRLPRHDVRVTYTIGDTRHSVAARMDTLLLLPDEERFVMVWRAAFSCDKKLLKVSEVTAERVESGAEVG